MQKNSRYPLYKQHRISGLAPRAAAAATGISFHGGYKHERTFEEEMGPIAYDLYQSPHARRAKRARSQEAAKLRNELRPAESIPKMSSVEMGALAEDYVYYKFRRRGYQVFRPLYSHKQLDLVAIVNGKTIKFEVKSTCGVSCSLMRTVYNDGSYKRAPYDNFDMDFFIMVDLNHENIFILPPAETLGKRTIGIMPGSAFWKYKDRYDLIEDF